MALILVAVIFLPRQVYPALSPADLHGVASASTRIDLQNARFTLQNDFRGQLIQVLAGLVVVAGAAAGLQQIRIAREGQITERFTRAIDHLGSDKLDVRLGGIYALERIALNSPADRASVTRILTAFVREHAPWLVGSPDGPQHPTPDVDDKLPWLSNRANDVQAAMHVLARRPPHPGEPRLLLTRTDLRGLYLDQARLDDAFLRHVNLARARIPGARLERSDMGDADLRRAKLRGANIAHADLRSAHLQEADLRQAVLRHADLRGANLTGALLDGADLTGVQADDTTIWPATEIAPSAIPGTARPQGS
ncbi:MAG TPA: pentapeptide repeat-containing protein [Streptosporangiaceae bacterium]